jgi:hypothetical protein
MFEDIAWFFVILVSSIIIKNVLFSRDIGPFKTTLMGLAYVGVLVHELCHFLMSFLVGIMPRGIEVKYRSERTGMANPHGSVTTKPQLNFLQALLICLAPLYISTWLIYWSLAITFNDLQAPLVRILTGFFCISLFIGAAPSNPDFKNIPVAFQKDPHHSIYQISLVSLAILLNWMIVSIYEINFWLDVYYYVAIVITYFLLKYSLVGVNKIIITLRFRYLQGSSSFNHKNFTRRIYKPIKSHKIGIEEAQW